MTLTVNGDTREIAGSMTVEELLVELGLGPGWVVVEVNREVVGRANHGAWRLLDGDVIEIVKAVAGG